MHTFLIISLILVLLILCTLLSCALYMSVRYKRSYMASLVDIYLRIRVRKNTKDDYIKSFEKLDRSRMPRVKFPKISKRGLTLTEENENGMQIFRLEAQNNGQGEKNAAPALIYFYGGGYIRPPRISHFRFAIRLAKKSGLTLYMPMYKRLPYATHKEIVECAKEYYLSKMRGHPSSVIIGDSSGGGLALLLMQALKKEEQPRCAILLSPFVDVSLPCEDAPLYAARDPLLFLEDAGASGELFADGCELKSPEVSPAYGDFSLLPPLHFFVGERELLFPDIDALHKRLIEENIPHNYKIGRGMNHVYQIYPIPEAKESLLEITEIIKQSFTKSQNQ